VRALVLDMQARLLLEMLGKGIESALVNPATLLPEPWQATSETLSGIESDKMSVDQALAPSIQVSYTSNPIFGLLFSFQKGVLVLADSCIYINVKAYVDAVLDLASHFITRLRRYASFCRTLASHAVGASSGPGSARSMVTSPPHNNSPSQTTNQGEEIRYVEFDFHLWTSRVDETLKAYCIRCLRVSFFYFWYLKSMSAPGILKCY
jgi:hypothetical protein